MNLCINKEEDTVFITKYFIIFIFPLISSHFTIGLIQM